MGVRHPLFLMGVQAAGGGAPQVVDTFTDANGTNITAHNPEINTVDWAWTSGSGTWTIEGGQLANGNADAVYRSVYGDFGYVDLSMQVRLATFSSAGVPLNAVVRYQDHSNHWQIACDKTGGTVKISRRAAGSPTLVATGSHAITDGDILRVDCYGNTIDCYINGDLVVSYTSATDYNTTTKCGVAKGADSSILYRWDNFAVVRYGETLPF